ncbi:helix-turn-helix domain-containing protein [Anoxybacterium hadale]|uniref:Helix-turn-helix domain-containing protein n=1 Tax=Anoxybacterium hadale TaxID=3408580 RepID=A0ACD1A8E3_9FIRM|nr:helix-turn-helix domain-containing protein [Clostridiales bacterium]
MLEIINYPEGLPVHVQLSRIHHYPIHNHKDIQILYVLEGELDLKLAYTHYYLPKNSIHIIHSNDVHSITSISDENLVLILNISIAYFTNFFPNLENIVFTTNLRESTSAYKNQLLLREQIFSILSEQYNKRPGYESIIKEITISLLTTLINHFRGFVINPDNRLFEHKTAHDLYQVDRISRIVSYVYENYPYKLSLSKIAEKENINLHYLSHLFQKFVGDSFRDFLSLVRVEMSEAELLSTSTPIAQIAQNAGFSDTKYYVENFRNWFGMHPKEYRRRFSGEVLGFQAAEAEDLPLEYLKTTISQYTSFPVFKDISAEMKLINLDFKAPAAGLSLKLDIQTDVLKNLQPGSFLFRQACSDEAAPLSMYYNDLPHTACLRLLREMTQTNTISPSFIQLSDSLHSTNGLYAVNGLKKPLFYFLELLSQMERSVLEIGSEYIVTKSEGNYSILAFNESVSNKLTLDFNLRGIDNCKLTQQKLVSAKSCVAFWCQLNFKSKLSEKDKQFIDRMSMPEISFQILTKAACHQYTCSLDPQDIVFIMLERNDIS